MAPRVKLIPDLESLPPESKAVLERYLEDTGGEYLKIAVDVDHPWRKKNTPEHNEWVTQFVKVLGYSPGLLKSWLAKDWYMVRQSLIAKRDVQLTEMIGLVVAIALECPYCIAWHSAASRFEGAEPDLVSKLRDYDQHRNEFSDVQQAAFDYARKIALHAYKVTDGDVENLQRWFDIPQVVELTELACHMSALSKFFSALNVEIW